jgi:SAM-dependent methyltransferase
MDDAAPERSGADDQALTGEQLAALYRERFDDDDLEFKFACWRILCREFLQQYVARDATVLDLGAGSCEFINAIEAGEKIAVDRNPDTKRFAADAKVVLAPSTDLSEIETGSVDVVFSSNFFEHLPQKSDLVATLLECHRVLRDRGTILVLMPNLRRLPGAYWDYFDHHLPLTDRSLAEVLTMTGFEVERMIPRFLPYTVKDSRVPRSTAMFGLYLKARPLWYLFGRQMFAVAHRKPTP